MDLYIATLHYLDDMSEVIGVFDDEQVALAVCGLTEARLQHSDELHWKGYQEVMNGHYGMYGIGGGLRNYFVEKLSINVAHEVGAL